MRTKLLGMLKVYEEEISLLLWTTALLFIVRSSGMILNNYAETAFLKRYGVEFMPVVNMANAVVTFLVTGYLTSFLNRISGARLLTRVFIASGIIVTVIRLAIPLGFDLLYPVLFMLKSQFELLQAMLFWNMCNDLFNTRQSKRLFPLLTAGGVLGLILGSFVTPYFASTFNLDNLLYLYLCTCLAGAALIKAMARSYAPLIYTEKAGGKGGKNRTPMSEEIKKILPLLKDSVLVKIVLVLTFMPNVIIPIMNYQFNYAINDQFASEEAMIQFFGYFRGGLNIISLFILLFVGRIYGRWGLPVALMFHPFNYILALTGFLLRFDVLAAMYARMSTTIIRTTINVPAQGILIGLFPESYRNLIRPFLRGTVVRAALFTGSTLILISDSLFHPRYLTLVALPFLLAWMAAPIVLKANYSKILKDLIANNLLDIKSLNSKELGQIFNQEKTLEELKASFFKARGEDAVWYAKLLKNFDPKGLDQLLLDAMPLQDPATRITFIKMISPASRKKAASRLLPFLDPQEPELTIAILKLTCKYGMDASKDVELDAFIHHDHPVVRGFAGACFYHRNPPAHQDFIDQRLAAQDLDMRKAGIISAGLSNRHSYIDPLLAMLEEKEIEPIIPDIIRALSRLGARELNSVVFSFLSHRDKLIQTAALDALEINDDVSLKKTVLLMGSPSDTLHEFAKEKINAAEYQNPKLLVESLGLPSSRIRRGLFQLLENLDIKDLEILFFAKESLNKSYTFLAMHQTLAGLPQSPMTELTMAHLLEKKEVVLENIIRVLAIHDQTGRMKTAWKGIFSSDTRQRANAIELLSDILDRKAFNAILPLLESPTPDVALRDGKKAAKIPQFEDHGREVVTRLLESESWVDQIMGLGLIRETPELMENPAQLTALTTSLNPFIEKEALMTASKDTAAPAADGQTPEITLGEKILLLREIEIFSGLSAAELAAIAAVTTELSYPEDRNVIKQDTVGETVFLTIEGKVAVIKERENGQEEILDHMEGGSAFGEMALIDDAPRSATIRTVTPCRFLILHKQEFKETAMEFPGIALQICSVLSQRIRSLHTRFLNQES